jgi:transposase InsO family protein
VASESPERLEELRERFLVALYEVAGGVGAGRTAAVSAVGQQAGLDPEGNPQDRALCERLKSELVESGYVSAEAGPSGQLAVTEDGARAIGRGQI